jgi:hypothetical protein
MKSKYFLVSFLLILVISCTKDSGGKPTTSIESITSIVPPQGTMVAKIKFTQNNGKLANGTFISIRNRLNQIQIPPATENIDTLVGPIPNFPDKNKGEFEFQLDWVTYLHQSDAENDTIQFKFAVVDTDGNKSDTITSPIIVILSQ